MPDTIHLVPDQRPGTGNISPLFFSDQLLDLLNDVIVRWNLFRRIPGNNTAAAVDEKLCKIPTDIALEIGFRRQIFIERMLVVAFDADL